MTNEARKTAEEIAKRHEGNTGTHLNVFQRERLADAIEAALVEEAERWGKVGEYEHRARKGAEARSKNQKRQLRHLNRRIRDLYAMRKPHREELKDFWSSETTKRLLEWQPNEAGFTALKRLRQAKDKAEDELSAINHDWGGEYKPQGVYEQVAKRSREEFRAHEEARERLLDCGKEAIDDCPLDYLCHKHIQRHYETWTDEAVKQRKAREDAELLLWASLEDFDLSWFDDAWWLIIGDGHDKQVFNLGGYNGMPVLTDEARGALRRLKESGD